MFPRQKSRGVTLLELMVILAILVLLAALLVPVSTRMTNRSKLLRCAAQQKQIGTALHLYAAERNGHFPPFIQGGIRLNSSGNQNTLANQLIPPKNNYLPDNAIFLDPGALGRLYTRNASGWADWEGQANRSGYWHVYMSPTADSNPQRADEDQFGANDTVRCPPFRVLMHCYYVAQGAALGAHPGGEVNVLKIDGSVQFYGASDYDRKKSFKDNFGHKESR